MMNYRPHMFHAEVNGVELSVECNLPPASEGWVKAVAELIHSVEPTLLEKVREVDSAKTCGQCGTRLATRILHHPVLIANAQPMPMVEDLAAAICGEEQCAHEAEKSFQQAMLGINGEGQGKSCAHCRLCSTETLLRCGRCKSVFYCCSDCQKADWPHHKTNCVPLK